MAEAAKDFSQGQVYSGIDLLNSDILKEVVDYRGDVTITLRGGEIVEGYCFNRTNDRLELLPKTTTAPASVSISQIDQIAISGKDTASGTGWEDWQKKKASERAAIKSLPIEEE